MKHLPIIDIFTIPHNCQDYDTIGNYGDDNGIWWVEISEMGWEYEMACLIHEISEMALTKKNNINWDKITKFDIESGLDNPGESKKSPYHLQHKQAEKIEKLFCKEMGISWKKYDSIIDKLKYD